MPEPLVAFRGAVSCQRAPGALRLTLSGEAAPGARVTLTFGAAAAADLPAVLQDPVIEELAAAPVPSITRTCSSAMMPGGTRMKSLIAGAGCG